MKAKIFILFLAVYSFFYLQGQTVNFQDIGSINNIRYITTAGIKQVSSVPSAHSVSCVYPKTGSPTNVYYSISTDGGTHWAYNRGPINALNYTASILFTNNGIDSTALRLHYVSGKPNASQTILRSGTINSNLTSLAFNVSQDLSTTQNALSLTQDIVQQDSQTFWFCTDSGAGDFYIYKGIYNSQFDTMAWVLHSTLTPNWNINLSGTPFYTSPKMAFSPDGSTGYICTFGDVVGGRDSIYQPIIWSYNASLGTWGNTSEIDINSSTDLKNYVQQWLDTTGLPISTDGRVSTAFHFDMTVDALGNPHVFCVVAPADIDFNPYAISSGFGMQMIDITKDASQSWTMIGVAAQKTFRVIDASSTYVVDAAVQLTRSQDGNYIFYTWNDTDTNLFPGNDNSNPDLFGNFLDVQNFKIGADSINWTATNTTTWQHNTLLPKTAPLALTTPNSGTCGITFSVPTITIHANTLQNMPAFTNIFYVQGIEYDCGSPTIVPNSYKINNSVGISAVSTTPSFHIYPNPAKNNITIEGSLLAEDVVNINLYSFEGKNVSSYKIENSLSIKENISLLGLPSGIYFLSINTKGGSKNFKLMIE